MSNPLAPVYTVEDDSTVDTSRTTIGESTAILAEFLRQAAGERPTPAGESAGERPGPHSPRRHAARRAQRRQNRKTPTYSPRLRGRTVPNADEKPAKNIRICYFSTSPRDTFLPPGRRNSTPSNMSNPLAPVYTVEDDSTVDTSRTTIGESTAILAEFLRQAAGERPTVRDLPQTEPSTACVGANAMSQPARAPARGQGRTRPEGTLPAERNDVKTENAYVLAPPQGARWTMAKEKKKRAKKEDKGRSWDTTNMVKVITAIREKKMGWKKAAKNVLSC
ncbi:hypothetical protein NQ318_015738 [Aromia moschata]|uniref:Uncharacterized protein n=1 Tax=Aromia moschata TaxID=1265417 RepID=A0AAV8X3R8_9CUCU|nr:hypothetical protein NQ318_015738 [Aromia moschata]